ncbi:hypothetical protein HRbin36_01294 [bacterium HR36]|nr:hypothetical protein HRbin36_01294 [bacterium HR36]
MPLRLRQWISRHIYLHDAVVHGPTEQPSRLRRLKRFRGMCADTEQDSIHVAFDLHLYVDQRCSPENGKNLFVEAEHPAQAFVWLCYLGVLEYSQSQCEKMRRNSEGQKLWLYDEVDITRKNGERYPVHRILFSDGTIAEIVFRDFHCFEARLL